MSSRQLLEEALPVSTTEDAPAVSHKQTFRHVNCQRALGNVGRATATMTCQVTDVSDNKRWRRTVCDVVLIDTKHASPWSSINTASPRSSVGDLSGSFPFQWPASVYSDKTTQKLE